MPPVNPMPAFTDSVFLGSKLTPTRRGDASTLRGAQSASAMTSPAVAKPMADGNGDLAA
jgi:hypothetical protein